MDNYSPSFSEAARETEFLYASSPSPISGIAYYVIFSTDQRREVTMSYTANDKEPPTASRSNDRRKNGSGARPNGVSLPLPAAPALLPFSSFFAERITASLAKPFSGWHSLLKRFQNRK